jgi:hypothetical protein
MKLRDRERALRMTRLLLLGDGYSSEEISQALATAQVTQARNGRINVDVKVPSRADVIDITIVKSHEA